MSAADMQESFGRLPDCQPAVEGEMVPLSKQRLADGGWLTVYKFRKQVAGQPVVERLRHFAMWKNEQGVCRFKVYETALPADHATLEASYIQSPQKSPLPYSGKVAYLEPSPMVQSNASPGTLLTTADTSPMQYVPDSQTKESTTRRALMP